MGGEADNQIADLVFRSSRVGLLRHKDQSIADITGTCRCDRIGNGSGIGTEVTDQNPIVGKSGGQVDAAFCLSESSDH